ncbi:pilus assembly protein CpaF [Paenibacillus cellulosilyticus]|uniref:Pilus assembly protein CpaF n=2 Tax=Paenibacillus cellulosilyticus TaxID=375489 RepID=A0A2V2YST4_9BACL|nr:pilus assembly protein CpaF [Paenibacillus cellulosilyticus]QKS46826.1 Flp pilus assembly complex ATPase component TadA [Paenibacillus cellulosilyticus]
MTATWLERPFDVLEYAGANQEQAAASPKRHTNAVTETFKKACQHVLTYFKDKNDKQSEKETDKWRQLQHEAVVGKPEAVRLFQGEIDEVLRSAQLMDVDYPSYYDSVVEAVFQETFGLGPISTWWKHPKFAQSQSARIIGTRIFFDIPGEPALRSFRFESVEKVENIIDKIRMKDEFAHINKFNPKLEIDLEDGTRVLIMIPPRVKQTTIVFRNYTMRTPRLSDFVRTGSMPVEALPIVTAIGRSMLNVVLAGKVRSGKSTLLKALFDERYRQGQVAVTIERGHFELKLSETYPDAQLIEMVVMQESDYDSVFDLVLRSDYNFCVIGESRSVEIELYCNSCERGEGGAMTTYHTEQTENIPGQFARLVLQRYKNRSYIEEVIRVANILHYVLVMRELPGGAKQLFGIAEIRLDPQTLAVSSHYIMRWDNELKDWTYKYDVSPATVQKMKERAPEEAEAALATLQRLEQEKPMRGSHIEYALSSQIAGGS